MKSGSKLLAISGLAIAWIAEVGCGGSESSDVDAVESSAIQTCPTVSSCGSTAADLVGDWNFEMCGLEPSRNVFARSCPASSLESNKTMVGLLGFEATGAASIDYTIQDTLRLHYPLACIPLGYSCSSWLGGRFRQFYAPSGSCQILGSSCECAGVSSLPGSGSGVYSVSANELRLDDTTVGPFCAANDQLRFGFDLLSYFTPYAPLACASTADCAALGSNWMCIQSQCSQVTKRTPVVISGQRL